MFLSKNRTPVRAFTCFLLLVAGRAFAQSADPDSVAVVRLIEQSRAFNHAEKIDSALIKAQEAYHLSLKRYGNDHVLTARSALYVARGYRERDRELEALTIVDQSLRVFKLVNDTIWQANCHNNNLICLRKLLRYDEAHAHAQAAYALLTPEVRGHNYLLANVRINEATAYISEKRYSEALVQLDRAYAYFTKIKDSLSLGIADFHYGGVYYGLNDFVRAQEYYLSSWAHLHNKVSPAHSYFADLHVRIGRCCQKTGDPETGLHYLLAAREAYLKAGTEDLNYLRFLEYFGQFYFDEGQYGEAMKQFEMSLETRTRLGKNHNRNMLKLMYSMGETGIASGDLIRGEQCLQDGLRIVMDSCGGNPQLAFPFVAQLADIQNLRADHALCIALCDSAFLMAGFDADYPENCASRNHGRTLCTIYARAHTNRFEATGDQEALQTAERYFGIAARLLFLEMDEISVESSREIFYDKDHEVLDAWLHSSMTLYLKTNNPEYARLAFQIASRERAFLLSDAMRRSGALRYAGVPDSILQSERLLRESIADAEKKRVQNNLLSVNQTDSAALVLNNALATARRDHDALSRQIERDYPSYFLLSKLKASVSIEELQKDHLEPDQALLVYSPTKTAVYAFVVTRDTFVAQKLKLASDIDAFNRGLTTFFTDPDPDDASYDRNLGQYATLAQSLYNDLVGPLEAILPGRLIIVPGGNLCYLPFEALLSGKPGEPGNWKSYPFWTKQKAIRYALSPDLSMQSRTKAGKKAQKSWLGMAPFATEAEVEHLASRSGSGETYAALPFSGKEVRTIAAQVHGDVWLDTTSSTDRFRREAPAYRILHLATHSRADDRQGDYSYLVLSPSGERLPARDLYQYELPAEMVVLSSCEAGGGRLINGEGIIGLVRAFTYAGAQSVVASQWVTGDQSSAELMIAFYRFLEQGLPRDEALRSARLYLMNQFPDQGHPFYWAGFRLFGDMERGL